MQSHHCVGALNVKAKARKEAALLTVVAVALYWRRTARVCITKAPKAEAWMIFVGADKKAQARAEAKAEAEVGGGGGDDESYELGASRASCSKPLETSTQSQKISGFIS